MQIILETELLGTDANVPSMIVGQKFAWNPNTQLYQQTPIQITIAALLGRPTSLFLFDVVISTSIA